MRLGHRASAACIDIPTRCDRAGFGPTSVMLGPGDMELPGHICRRGPNWPFLSTHLPLMQLRSSKLSATATKEKLPPPKRRPVSSMRQPTRSKAIRSRAGWERGSTVFRRQHRQCRRPSCGSKAPLGLGLGSSAARCTDRRQVCLTAAVASSHLGETPPGRARPCPVGCWA